MKLDGNCYTVLHSVASPFLSTGVTAAVFQIDGKTPSFKQRLKKRVKWTEITSFAAINNLLCIKSGPVAFLVLRLFIISLTSNSVSLISFISQSRNVTCGSGSSSFSKVACSMKKSLSVFAFSLLHK